MIDFQGFKKWCTAGEYILAVLSEDDGMMWTYTANELPIFDLGTTKIFQAEESGVAEVCGVESGDEFRFSIHGIRVTKVYDFFYFGEVVS